VEAKDKKPPMGTRGYFPSDDLRRREDATLSPGERVAHAIELSRTATRLAASVTRTRRQ